MNLHGKGDELRKDITKLFDPDVDKTAMLDIIDKKYGKHLKEVITDNYILPLGLNIKDTKKIKQIVNSLDFFCAAFIKPIT